MNQDDCILRILRCDRQDHGVDVGTVEQVGKKPKAGFMDFEELPRIMGVHRGQRPWRGASIRGGDGDEQARAPRCSRSYLFT